MRIVSNNFKNAIKEYGKQLDSKITYTLNGTSVVLGMDDLNSVNYHYNGDILKSVMKQLDIDSNVDIQIGTILEYQFGVFTGSQYEYISFGNFVVYSSEKKEDTNSYQIVCYDKMLYAMVDYKKPQRYNSTRTAKIDITYPITIRNYLIAICDTLELNFKNTSENFTNYNKTIDEELYLDEDGKSLDYTFRDVLDDLAEITASTICVENNTLELRYIPENVASTPIIDTDYFKDTNVNFGEALKPINTITFKRSEDSDVYSISMPSNLSDDLKNEIVIFDNPILNSTNRSQFATQILGQLYDLTFTYNNFKSTGIGFLELCDRYNVQLSIPNEDGTTRTATYPCVMLNDEFIVTQGLEENIFTEKPQQGTTDYNTSAKNEREDIRASIIVNKKIGEVDIRGKTINLTADTIGITSTNFSVDTNGNITANGGTIAGYTITDDELYAVMTSPYNYTQSDLTKIRDYIMETGTLTPEEKIKYDIDGDGDVTPSDYVIIKMLVEYHITTTNGIRVILSTGKGIFDSAFKIQDGNGTELVKLNIEGLSIYNALYKPFKHNDIFEIGNSTDELYAYAINGLITNGGQDLRVSIPLPQPVSSDVNSVVPLSIIVKARGRDGYIENNAFNDYTSISSAQLVGNTINLTIRKGTAFTNGYNNSPISLIGYFQFKFD